MKKIVLSSALLILIPTLLFVPVYVLMVYTVQAGVKDYSSDVIGVWQAFQYYYESERFVCGEDNYMTLTLTEDTLTIDSTILPDAEEVSYTWAGGASFSYDSKDGVLTFFVDFDAQNNLKLSMDDGSYIILLRRGG